MKMMSISYHKDFAHSCKFNYISSSMNGYYQNVAGCWGPGNYSHYSYRPTMLDTTSTNYVHVASSFYSYSPSIVSPPVVLRNDNPIRKRPRDVYEDEETVDAAFTLLSLPGRCKYARSLYRDEGLSDDTRSMTPSEIGGDNSSILTEETSEQKFSNIQADSDDDSEATSLFFSLYTPEDEDVLSPLHCFMRKHCIEVFTASSIDVQHRKASTKISVGTVGIRCIFCKNRPFEQRQARSVCYPSSLQNIYHSIESYQRRHAKSCEDIPEWVRQEMSHLIETCRSSAGGRRQYWVEAGLKIGLIDTNDGIKVLKEVSSIERSNDNKTDTSLSKELKSNQKNFILSKDKPLVTNYLFLLMSQMEPCYFAEEDRSSGRSRVKSSEIGFPGFQCKHCGGKSGLGRYFPSSVESMMLANSDRNIHNHMMKCRRCPIKVKNDLLHYRDDVLQEGSKNKRGSRKAFFCTLWNRLHGEDVKV